LLAVFGLGDHDTKFIYLKRYHSSNRGGKLSREERYSGVPREQFDFCDSCGKKLPLSAMAAKCSVCKGVLCSECAVQYQGRWYCKAHAPTPPQPEKKGCFIATAAYGTPLAMEIEVLRSFRDRSMDENRFGRRLIKLYYQMSPKIADAIFVSELRRKTVRAFLNPLVKFFRRLGY